MSRHPLATLLLASSLALAGCSLVPGGGDDPTPKTSVKPLVNTAWNDASRSTVKQGGTLRLATSALPTNFNPLSADGAQTDAVRILAPTQGGAVRVTADGGWEVDPDYAKSVKVVDKSPLTVEVKLNPRAVWQGGTPITAADMVAFWKSQNGSNDTFLVGSTTGYDEISAVTPGDDRFSYTVTFKTPTGDWPRYIYPRLPANVSSSPSLFNDAFVSKGVPSNGPFVVSKVDAAAGLVTEVPNPRWWGKKPKLSRITWRAADPAVQAKAYVADELDAVDLVPSTYAQAATTGVVQRAAGTQWTQITLNGASGPLKDVKVRRAIALAIDRSAISARLARQLGSPAVDLGSFVLLPGQRGYVDQSALIAHDVAKAATLLADAGYTKGADGILTRKGEPLTLAMPVPTDTPTAAARATSIAADLKKVGIHVVITKVPAKTFFDEYVVPLNFDLATFTWSGSAFPVADAERRFYPLDSGENFTGVEDDDLGGAWQKGIVALDEPERFRVVKVLDKRLLRDVPMIPLTVIPTVMALKPTLVNYGASQFELPDWTLVGFAKPAT